MPGVLLCCAVLFCAACRYSASTWCPRVCGRPGTSRGTRCRPGRPLRTARVWSRCDRGGERTLHCPVLCSAFPLCRADDHNGILLSVYVLCIVCYVRCTVVSTGAAAGLLRADGRAGGYLLLAGRAHGGADELPAGQGLPLPGRASEREGERMHVGYMFGYSDNGYVLPCACVCVCG